MLKKFIIFWISSFVLSQEELTTSNCGSSVACFKSPASCSSSDTCDALVMISFNPNVNDTVNVTVSTKAGKGYVGFAQNEQLLKMIGAKGVVCFSNGSIVQLKSFATTRNKQPTLETLADGYSLIESYLTSKNSVVCKFTQMVNVPSGSERLMYSLADPLHILYAHGNFKAGSILYHGLEAGGADITDTKVDLTSIQELKTDECGKSQTCDKFPTSCTTSENCDSLIMYKHDILANNIDVTLSTKSAHAYVGWAQSKTKQGMTGAKGVVCFYDGTTVQLKSFQTDGDGQPDLQQLPNGYTLSKAYRTANGSTVCEFKRTITVPSGSENLMYDFTNPLHIVKAFGEYDNIKNQIKYHREGKANALISTEAIILVPKGVPELTTSDCGSSATCFKLPASCSSSDTCDALVIVSYNPNVNDIVNVTVSTKAGSGYVGWGQNKQFNEMIGAKGVICFNDGSTVKLASFASTENKRPTLKTLADGYTLVESYLTNKNSVVCKFTQTVNVPDGSESLMHSLADPLHMLYAHGSYDSQTGNINRHGGGQDDAHIMDKKVDLTPAPTRIVFPPGCSDNTTCNAIIEFAYDNKNQKMVFTLTTKNRWVANALRPDAGSPRMVNIKGQYCVKGGGFGSFDGSGLTSNGAPNLFPGDVPDVTLKSINTTDGILQCVYEREVKPSAGNKFLHDLSNPLTVVVAFGQSGSGKSIAQHGYSDYGYTESLDLLKASETIPIKELTTDECGKSQTCDKFPTSCTTSENCDSLIMYKDDILANNIDVTLSTKSTHAYLGWAQSKTKQGMTGAKGVVCFYDGTTVQLKSFQTDGDGQPDLQQLPNGYTLSKAYRTANGSTVCEFKRTITVPSGSENLMYDFTNPLHIVKAFGEYDNIKNQIKYHREGKANALISTEAIILVPKGVPTRIVFPPRCSDNTTCNAIIEFAYDNKNQKMVFTLTTKNRWVANALRPDAGSPRMVKIKGQYCVKGGGFGSLDGSALISNNAPNFSPGDVPGVTLKSINTTDGILQCVYEREVKPSAGNKFLHDLSNLLTVVVAFGQSGSGKSIAQHGNGDYGYTEPFDLLKASGTIPTKAGRELAGAEIAHGILMLIAWVICSTIGIFVARYLKPYTKDKKIMGKQAWFPIHQLLMLLCVILFLTAFIIILVEKKGWSKSVGTHGILGVIAVILGLIQPLMAMVRPDPDSEKRFIFNWLHRTCGMSAWIIAGLSIIYAFEEHIKKSYTLMVVFMVVVVGIFIFLDLIQLVLTRNGATADVAYSSKKQEVSGANPSDGDTTPQAVKTTIPLLFCMIIVVFSLVVGVYHITTVAAGIGTLTSTF